MTKAKCVVVSVLLVAGVLATGAAGPAAAQQTGPALTLEGAGPFAPGTAVSVTLTGAVESSFGEIAQCSADGLACGTSVHPVEAPRKESPGHSRGS